MKTICCVALLLSGYAQAGTLLPMSGEEDEYIQEALTEKLDLIVASLPEGVTVEPILESYSYSGRMKRILFGPLVRGGHVTLRIRISGDEVSETVVTEESGAWRGTFRPGNDYEMIEAVTEAAANFIREHE